MELTVSSRDENWAAVMQAATQLVGEPGARELEGWLSKHDSAGHAANPRRARLSALVCSVYPDQVKAEGGQETTETPISRTLTAVRRVVGQDAVVHLLPPYVSAANDRFAVVDDSRIDADFGTWENIAAGAPVMLDCTVAQLSRDAEIAKRALAGDVLSQRLFYRVSDNFDLSAVAAPLVELDLAGGRRFWSSYGGQQLDLNYEHWETLALAIERVTRLASAAQWLRLDGIAYTWKESGTSCANLPGAHAVARFYSALWHMLIQGGIAVAEADDYEDHRAFPLGAGDRVVNYRLPPALAFAVVTGHAAPLVKVLKASATRSRGLINPGMTHDGITLRAWNPVLSPRETDELTAAVERAGVPLRRRGGERQVGVPYELHGTWFELAGIRAASRPHRMGLLLGVVSTILCQRGTPALYFPELFPIKGAAESLGREKVRGKISQKTIQQWTEQDGATVRRIINIRQDLGIFGPDADQEVEALGESAMVIRRASGGETVEIGINFGEHPVAIPGSRARLDMLARDKRPVKDVRIAPYDVKWLMIS